MNKVLHIFVALAITCAVFALPACKDELDTKIHSLAQMNSPDYTIGVLMGTVAMTVTQETFPDAKIKYYNNAPDATLALLTNKTDMIIGDLPYFEYVAGHNPQLMILPDEIKHADFAIGAAKKNKDLMVKVNQFIAKYKADGTYQDMYNRWLKTDKPKMPDIPKAKNPKKTLIVGTEGLYEPFSFFDAGQVSGFDIEFAERLALFLDMELKIRTLPWDALLGAVQSGNVDLGIAALDASKENAEAMLLSEPYINSAVVAMARKDNVSEYKQGSLSGTQHAQSQSEKSPISFGKNEVFSVGVLSGAIFDMLLKEKFPNAEPKYFQDFSSQLTALKSGKLDAVMFDSPKTTQVLADNPELELAEIPYIEAQYAFAVSKSFNKKTMQQLNSFMKELEKTGELERLQQKWLGRNKASVIPLSLKTTGKNGNIRVAALMDSDPFSYQQNEQVTGYEIEVLNMFAQKFDYGISPSIMNFDAAISSLTTDKIDIMTGCIMITEERKKSFDFAYPHYVGSILMVARSKNAVAPSQTQEYSFAQTLKNRIFRTLLEENRWKMIAEGIGMTIIITLASAFFGTIFGFFLCLVRRCKNMKAVMASRIFIRLIQGIPIVVFLMLLYYVVFAQINLNAVIVAIIGFSINFGVYFAEMLRSGIDGVGKGQIEAALAMGFSKVKVFMLFVLPQAVRQIMPVYKGEIISLLKMTAIVGYIAIEDLTKMSDIIRSRTYEAFTPLIITTVIYLIIAYFMIWVLTVTEKKIDPKQRPRIIKGVKTK